MGQNAIWVVNLEQEEIWTQKEALRMDAHRGKSMEDTGGRQPLASQENPQEKANLLAPWSWTYGLQNYEKINFCILSHPVHGILLWHLSKQIKQVRD